jgi:hypothetical protein
VRPPGAGWPPSRRPLTTDPGLFRCRSTRGFFSCRLVGGLGWPQNSARKGHLTKVALPTGVLQCPPRVVYPRASRTPEWSPLHLMEAVLPQPGEPLPRLGRGLVHQRLSTCNGGPPPRSSRLAAMAPLINARGNPGTNCDGQVRGEQYRASSCPITPLVGCVPNGPIYR